MARHKRTERFEFLKEKRTSLLYGEAVKANEAPMMDQHKIYLPKYVFNGKIPSEIDITLEWDDEV